MQSIIHYIRALQLLKPEDLHLEGSKTLLEFNQANHCYAVQLKI